MTTKEPIDDDEVVYKMIMELETLRTERALLLKTLAYPEHKYAFENLHLTRELALIKEQLREAQKRISELRKSDTIPLLIEQRQCAKAAEARNRELMVQVAVIVQSHGELLALFAKSIPDGAHEKVDRARDLQADFRGGE